MVSETERLTRLINNVLDFSKMERGRRSYAKKRLEAARVPRTSSRAAAALEHNGFTVSFADAGAGLSSTPTRKR